jgi:S-disulfanyl-L-cysteine oxidoreductase SoxD
MRRFSLFILALLLTAGVGAQGPTYKLGKTPTNAEIRAMDTLVDQDGKLLPEGQGTVAQGAPLYAQRCAMCHGPNGEGTNTPAGVGPLLVAPNQQGTRGIRGYTFSTTLFSFIIRAMPMHQERTISVDEAYALTAYLYYRNGIIRENEVMNTKTLPQVTMPNRGAWSPPPETSG